MVRQPSVSSTNAPAVKIILPADGVTFHTHADIPLRVLATPHGSALEPPTPASKSVPRGSETWEFVTSPEDAYSVANFLPGRNSPSHTRRGSRFRTGETGAGKIRADDHAGGRLPVGGSGLA